MPSTSVPSGPALGLFFLASQEAQGVQTRAPYILFALWYRQVPEHEAQENEIVYHVCDPKIIYRQELVNNYF